MRVVVTAGGGGVGYLIMDTYLSMLEKETVPPPFKSVLITGPFMPKQDRKKLNDRARRLKVRIYRFYRWMEKIQAAADLVVSMGGYNTVCEILTPGTPALLVPREMPRKEQLLRAQVFKRQNLVDYIPWPACTSEKMRQKVFSILKAPEAYQKAISRFQLTGLDVIRNRLQTFMNPEG